MRYILLLFLIFSACGKDTYDVVYKDPKPQPDGGEQVDWNAEVKGLVEAKCLSCHGAGGIQAPDLSTAAKFKNSNAKARIANGSMPPGGGLPGNEKDILISFLSE